MNRYFLHLACCYLLLIYAGAVVAAPVADGVAAYEAKNYKQAMQILLPLANDGNVEAQRRVGEMCYYGQGVEKNLLAAFKWNELAAANGDRVAMFNLGYLYERGDGVKQNQQSALNWYQKAALQNYAEAQYKLGLLYEPTDRNMALYWYERAYKQGHPLAKDKFNNLGRVLVAEQDERNARSAEERRRFDREMRAEERAERAERMAEQRQREAQADAERKANLESTMQAQRNMNDSIAQTAARNQQLIADAYAAQRHQQEEQREHQQEQRRQYQPQVVSPPALPRPSNPIVAQGGSSVRLPQANSGQSVGAGDTPGSGGAAQRQGQQEQKTCHDVNSWVSVTSTKRTDYEYCKVNFHTEIALTAVIKNNGNKLVSVNTCAFNSAGVKINCVEYPLAPGASLGGWVTDLVWCGNEPQSVRYSARLSDDPGTCNQM